MFKIAVLGYGRIGKAVTHFLTELSNKVTPYDLNNSNGVSCHMDDFIDKAWRYDAVISCLPYYENEFYARTTIDQGTAWFDLGGRVDVSRYINDYGSVAACNFVGTDLGLAPGLVNIMLEDALHKWPSVPDKVRIAVGGIPRKYDPNNPLNYSLTWSPEGLINEYADKCEIIKDGKIEIVDGMSGLEILWDASLFECFNTSGGAAHSIPSMLKWGVKNFAYKTIRWVGHHQILSLLLKHLSHDQIKDILLKECPQAPDKIVMHGTFNACANVFYQEILGEAGFSAMQTATAKPIAYIAHELLKGDINPGKYVLEYADYIPVLKKLKWVTI